MCGVVAILGVSCQLNAMTRMLLRVLKKMLLSEDKIRTNIEFLLAWWQWHSSTFTEFFLYIYTKKITGDGRSRVLPRHPWRPGRYRAGISRRRHLPSQP
jgi:hypothetical protein